MLTIQNIKVCHRLAPIGLDEAPSFSWILTSTNNNVYQTAYQICVQKDDEIIWNSERVESDQSVAVSYGGPDLEALAAYRVCLKVWDNYGEQAQIHTAFETGMLDNRNFIAQWITHTLQNRKSVCPVFFKEFSAMPVVRARLISSACGVYEASINDTKVSEELLAPGWTNYRKRIQHQLVTGNDHTVTDTDGRERFRPGQLIDLGLGDSQHLSHFTGIEGQRQIFDVGVCSFQTVSSFGFVLVD